MSGFSGRLRMTLAIARWEFGRFFKWRDQLVGLVLFAAAGALAFLFMTVVLGSGRTWSVAVVNPAGLPLAFDEASRVRVAEAAGRSVAELKAAVSRGELDGLLVVSGAAEAELFVAKEPRFREAVVAALGEARRKARLAGLGLSPSELDVLLAPFPLRVAYPEDAGRRSSRAEKVTAVGLVGAMLVAVVLSLAYLLTGITGEKQLRVTELVVSAVSPQTWIDGKILGVSAFAVANVLFLAVDLLAAVAATRLLGAKGLELPAVRPSVLLVGLVFTALGLLLWNSFLAAIAATVDDPNTSSRSGMMFLPVLPLILTLAILKDPDSTLSRVLALFPLTAPSALPARFVLTRVGPLEIVLSAALLLVAIFVARRLAGRIFEVGMLLYGKEPSLSEMLRWARGRGTERG